MDVYTKNFLSISQGMQELRETIHKNNVLIEQLRHQILVAETNVEQLRNEVKMLRYSLFNSGPTEK